MVDRIVSNEGADWYALVGHARVGIIDALATGCLEPQCKGERIHSYVIWNGVDLVALRPSLVLEETGLCWESEWRGISSS
jgi:hypothetical protein